MEELLASGFVDSFRYFYPEMTGAYTWWSYKYNSRANNTGWRIDYFLASRIGIPLRGQLYLPGGQRQRPLPYLPAAGPVAWPFPLHGEENPPDCGGLPGGPKRRHPMNVYQCPAAALFRRNRGNIGPRGIPSGGADRVHRAGVPAQLPGTIKRKTNGWCSLRGRACSLP